MMYDAILRFLSDSMSNAHCRLKERRLKGTFKRKKRQFELFRDEKENYIILLYYVKSATLIHVLK